MARFSIPYLKIRNGRPRWEPGPHLRKAGWAGRDLRHEDGRWMDEGEAMLAARAINDEVAAWRSGGKQRQRKAAPVHHPHSCQALFDRWYASTDFLKNGAKNAAGLQIEGAALPCRFRRASCPGGHQAPTHCVLGNVLHRARASYGQRHESRL